MVGETSVLGESDERSTGICSCRMLHVAIYSISLLQMIKSLSSSRSCVLCDRNADSIATHISSRLSPPPHTIDATAFRTGDVRPLTPRWRETTIHLGHAKPAANPSPLLRRPISNRLMARCYATRGMGRILLLRGLNCTARRFGLGRVPTERGYFFPVPNVRPKPAVGSAEPHSTEHARARGEHVA